MSSSTDRLAALLVAVALSFVPEPAAAGETPLHVSLSDEIPLTLAAAAVWLGVAGAQDQMGLHHCGWCAGPGPVDRTVRSALLAPDPEAAATASDVTGFIAVPVLWALTDILSVHLEDRGWMELTEDLIMVAESFLLTALVTRLVKIAVRRPRPYMEYGTMCASGGNDLLGFFSGHTSMAASMASAAATLSFLRGSRFAPWIAGVGGALVATTGILRISADRHYLSDVLVGLVVGTAMGVAVGWLHVRRSRVAVLPGPGSLTVVF